MKIRCWIWGCAVVSLSISLQCLFSSLVWFSWPTILQGQQRNRVSLERCYLPRSFHIDRKQVSLVLARHAFKDTLGPNDESNKLSFEIHRCEKTELLWGFPLNLALVHVEQNPTNFLWMVESNSHWSDFHDYLMGLAYSRDVLGQYLCWSTTFSLRNILPEIPSGPVMSQLSSFEIHRCEPISSSEGFRWLWHLIKSHYDYPISLPCRWTVLPLARLTGYLIGLSHHSSALFLIDYLIRLNMLELAASDWWDF